MSFKCPRATTAAQIGHWTHSGLAIAFAIFDMLFDLHQSMGGHISQKWYDFTTGDPEIDRYGWVFQLVIKNIDRCDWDYRLVIENVDRYGWEYRLVIENVDRYGWD